MGPIKTLHVVGFKNSGKTTLLNRWIRLLKEKGHHVSVIKHHGHGAKLDMPDETKDSMQYLYSGADVSLVSGGGFTQHIANREASFKELKQLASWNHSDIMLVEGYKAEQGEKVVLINREEDWQELKSVEGIVLVVGLESPCTYPQIDSREEVAQLDEWLLKWIKSAI
ncbi:molybdopterin-guanine dinucleotide biosynthesis protein B [Pseudogracilibacillus auburnensis]|uniref:Molybdopterin-guanine dinucleotide biosynthesis protein B n=1 Tax=Pseudogracilibacillus auburnensis TaxID=1494959 RepID=A0A2V3VUL7_9BACI|nr:molybdopterin-guanine dinucleotide biosynthesis protein B [Pseudogracilibacillus auburnensis]PXW85633.1 molybdopterin-guanine dinucleotide biosynthesis protein B [Pseudogracilibacillus auburnensis]